MHFENAKRQTVKLTAGCMVCWDAKGAIRYFTENGVQIEFVKDRNSDTMLAGHANDLATFRNRALVAAAFSNLDIKPIDGANAFKFV